MTTQEIAIKYGVPLPETSEKLDWKLDTIFIWIETSKGEKKIWQKESFEYISNAASKYGEDILNIPKKLFPAPQMHEIATLLKELSYNYEASDISLITKNGNTILAIGDLNYAPKYSVEIENNHYAQAYAELYLALKEKNLLKQ